MGVYLEPPERAAVLYWTGAFGIHAGVAAKSS
jgi:hypothetical protein